MVVGEIAVVTGGGSGIGAACCRELASRGARVAVLDRDEGAAKRMADEIGGEAVSCDIGREEDIVRAAAAVEATLGAVSIVVNCAGVVQGVANAYDLPMPKWDDIVRIDQRGTFLVCRTFARAMLERRRGAIVNIASVAGMRSMPMHAYAPAKAAVIAMTATLAAEWGPFGVRVNAVSPGFTLTDGMRAAIDGGYMNQDSLTSTAALRRMVAPEEIARAVVFLSSDQASGITGVNLPVDGGWLAGSPWVAYGGLPAPQNG